MTFSDIWSWLSDRENQSTLIFIGTGIVAIAGSLWLAYTRVFARTDRASPTETTPGTSNVTIGSNSPIIHSSGDVSYVSNNIVKAYKFGGGGYDISRYWERFRFSFIRETYVHPLVVKTLAGLISDSGETIVAIDIDASHASNRFHDPFNLREIEGVTWVFWEKDTGDIRPEAFLYHYIGTSPSGVHVLHCREGTGGTAVFNFIMLLALEAISRADPKLTGSNSYKRLALRAE